MTATGNVKGEVVLARSGSECAGTKFGPGKVYVRSDEGGGSASP
jgi:hypothetical protein